SMTGLKIDLHWLEKRLLPLNGSAAPLIDKIRSMVQITDQSIKTVRRICTELRPRILDDLGLTAAIDWQAREFEGRTGIKVELSLPEKPVVALDERRATAVFRIFQEILTNVARHAHATKVF